jgi:hypothetical protein
LTEKKCFMLETDRDGHIVFTCESIAFT